MFLKFLIFTFGSPKIFRDPATPRLDAVKKPESKARYYSIFYSREAYPSGTTFGPMRFTVW
jgi:hypothetical protein